MRPRLAISISFIAFAILILIQGYSISQTFRNKKEQFDLKYSSLVSGALTEYENYTSDSHLDTVIGIMDDLALNYIFNIDQVATNDDSLAFRNDILGRFTTILNQIQTDQFIADYLSKNEASTEMHSGISIMNLSLLDFDQEFPVLADSIYTPPSELKNALLARTYRAESNYFSIRFAYFVDLPERNRIIYREMTLTLLLAGFTILVVLFIFTLTTRNMLIQKKLSDMKSDFINNMTHELKTPLSTIAVATTTLSDDQMMENRGKVREISKIIKKQNKHLTELIERILDISIWEKDQVRLRKKKVHIWEFMNEKLDSFRIEYNNDKLKLTEEFNLEKDYITIDEVHMTTVLNNLLSNAVKYCENSPEIHVKVLLNDKLSIQISDNGIGLKKDELKHIFDKFYRVGKGDFKTVKGLGLGLYYVKQIVNAHMGEIFVTSNPGKGSTFTINIPSNNDHTSG